MLRHIEGKWSWTGNLVKERNNCTTATNYLLSVKVALEVVPVSEQFSKVMIMEVIRGEP